MCACMCVCTYTHVFICTLVHVITVNVAGRTVKLKAITHSDVSLLNPSFLSSCIIRNTLNHSRAPPANEQNQTDPCRPELCLNSEVLDADFGRKASKP